MEFKMSLLGIIVLVGAVLTIIGLALAWFSFGGFEISGFKWISELLSDSTGATWEAWVPLICLILAIVAIVLALLEFLGMGNMMMTRIPVMVLGLLIVVLSVVSARDGFDAAGIGFYLVVISGIVLLVAPLLSILKILPEE